MILDGACGTTIQSMDLPKSAWADYEGCNEYLNISCPEAIVRLHSDFIDAGSKMIETNTFGASSIVLAEYGLEKEVEKLNLAAVENAKMAIGDRDIYIAASVGPTTKLPSLGHITVDKLADSVRQQVGVLIEAGVDAILLETCQDLLQVKTSLVASGEAMKEKQINVPIMVFVTMESQGTMLVGSDISAVAAVVEPFGVFSLGLNCATGPKAMESHIRYLCQNFPAKISCVPNQGLPEVVDGEMIYPLAKEDFAELMKQFITLYGVSIVGGCCGTSADHIKALADAVGEITPAKRNIEI